MMRQLSIVALSLLLAVVLTIVPIPQWAFWLRPLLVPMVLCCWVLLHPEWVGIGFAFCVGVFLDVLLGTMLGEHALMLSCVAFITLHYQRRVLNFAPLQQGIMMLLLLLLYQMGHFYLQAWDGHSPGTSLYWISIVPSALLWPACLSLCRGLTQTARTL